MSSGDGWAMLCEWLGLLAGRRWLVLAFAGWCWWNGVMRTDWVVSCVARFDGRTIDETGHCAVVELYC